jgi:hypothetical protein
MYSCQEEAVPSLLLRLRLYFKEAEVLFIAMFVVVLEGRAILGGPAAAGAGTGTGAGTGVTTAGEGEICIFAVGCPEATEAEA